MSESLNSKSKSGTRKCSMLDKSVTIKFLQKDMENFRKNMQYPIDYSMSGSQYFKEEVTFAEVWIYSLKNKSKYYGRVMNGLLYLFQKEKLSFNGPQKLSTGKYKIWLDAWIRSDFHKDFYKGIEEFTDPDWKKWKPPTNIPKLKYWETISVNRPKQGEKYSFVWVKSRRFHWLYRLELLMSVLRPLLRSYESLYRDAMAFQQMGTVMSQFLWILHESGENIGVWLNRGDYPKWANMMFKVLWPVVDYTDKWVKGLDMDYPDLMNEIKHLNNLAALLWHFLEQQDFIRMLNLWDKTLPEEARVLVSLIGPILTRIPLAADFNQPSQQGIKTYAKNISPAWGTKFAEEIYKPFIASKRKKMGVISPPAFPPSKNSGKAFPEILDCVRKYIVGTLNGISVTFMTEVDIASKLSKHWEELADLLEWDEYFEPHHLVRLYREEMGKLPNTPDGKILRYVEERLEQIKNLEERPEKLTSAIAKTNPCAIYFLESFEVAIKGWIAVLAYQRLVIEGRKNLPRNLFDATAKTSSFVGSSLKSTILSNILTSRKIPASTVAKLSTWGKGLSFAGETVGAGIYICDKWLKDDLVGKEVAHYTDGDAYAIESFHIAVAYGKVVTAIGSGLSMTGIGAAPGVVLQGVGYAFQFVGDFLVELKRIGAAEKKIWQDMVENLRVLNLLLMSKNRAKLYRRNLLPDKNYQYLKAMVDDFRWLNIDKKKWDNFVNSFSTS